MKQQRIFRNGLAANKELLEAGVDQPREDSNLSYLTWKATMLEAWIQAVFEQRGARMLVFSHSVSQPEILLWGGHFWTARIFLLLQSRVILYPKFTGKDVADQIPVVPSVWSHIVWTPKWIRGIRQLFDIQTKSIYSNELASLQVALTVALPNHTVRGLATAPDYI